MSNFELSNNFQDNSNKYYNYVADQMDYAIEYATPINQNNNWQKEQQNGIVFYIVFNIIEFN